MRFFYIGLGGAEGLTGKRNEISFHEDGNIISHYLGYGNMEHILGKKKNTSSTVH